MWVLDLVNTRERRVSEISAMRTRSKLNAAGSLKHWIGSCFCPEITRQRRGLNWQCSRVQTITDTARIQTPQTLNQGRQTQQRNAQLQIFPTSDTRECFVTEQKAWTAPFNGDWIRRQ